VADRCTYVAALAFAGAAARCDLLIFKIKRSKDQKIKRSKDQKIKRSQPRFTRQLLQGFCIAKST
jgi:hypothetical protein